MNAENETEERREEDKSAKKKGGPSRNEGKEDKEMVASVNFKSQEKQPKAKAFLIAKTLGNLRKKNQGCGVFFWLLLISLSP